MLMLILVLVLPLAHTKESYFFKIILVQDSMIVRQWLSIILGSWDSTAKGPTQTKDTSIMEKNGWEHRIQISMTLSEHGWS